MPSLLLDPRQRASLRSRLHDDPVRLPGYNPGLKVCFVTGVGRYGGAYCGGGRGLRRYALRPYALRRYVYPLWAAVRVARILQGGPGQVREICPHYAM